MSGKRIGKISAKAQTHAAKTDWKKLRSLTDAEIERGIQLDSAIHPTAPDFWKTAKIVLPQRKQPVTIRLDADLLAWLRSQKGYQTRINAVLRTFMQASRRQAG